MNNGKLIVFSAPSGSGKTTIVKYLLEQKELHLDFSIAALFILIIVPLIKNLASLVGVLVTVIFVCIFKYFAIEAGIVLAALTGMLSAVCMQKAQKGAQK